MSESTKHCSTCACGLTLVITGRTVEITGEQRQMLTARGVDEIPSHDESQCWEPCGDLGKSAEHARLAPEPPAAPELGFGQAVTDGQIVAIYAGEEGAEFKLLRHNVHGVLSEVRRPWNLRSTFRPATYDEMRSACPHDWLIERYCSICRPSQPPRDGQ